MALNCLSKQPEIAGTSQDSAVRCANPKCSKELLYLRDGTLHMLDLEPQADGRFNPNGGPFATRRSLSKFFWLCGDCSKLFIVKRWTASGLIVALRDEKVGREFTSI
jgi:hypothetical protein